MIALVSALFFFQLAKSAKEAASKVQEHSKVIGKTESFKAVSAVCVMYIIWLIWVEEGSKLALILHAVALCYRS